MSHPDAHLEAFGLKRPLTQQAVYIALRRRGLTMRTDRTHYPPTFAVAWPHSRLPLKPGTLEQAVLHAFELVLDRSDQRPEEAHPSSSGNLLPEPDFDPLTDTPVGSTAPETRDQRRNRLRREATAKHRADKLAAVANEPDGAETTAIETANDEINDEEQESQHG